jgi:3-oxoacyl-[acyl-carrier-protein] synthase III
MIRSVVRGVGASLPKRVLSNREMETIVDTTDEWIVQRTGIEQRYIAGDGETTASLGAEAAEEALKAAGLTGQHLSCDSCEHPEPIGHEPRLCL